MCSGFTSSGFVGSGVTAAGCGFSDGFTVAAGVDDATTTGPTHSWRTTSPHAGAKFYIPFDGTNGDPNPMGTQPFVSCGFPTTTPSLSIETRPIIAYTEDGGQQGGVPTSVHPFQGFPDVPVVLQQFPQVLGSWFCDGDNFPLVNGYQVIQYSGDTGP